MGVFQAIGRGFSEASKLMSAALIFFIYYVVTGVISIPFSQPGAVDANGLPQVSPVTFIIGIVSGLVFVFLQGAVLGLIKDLVKKGAFDIKNVGAYGKKYYLPILGLILLIILIGGILIFAAALVSAGLLAASNNVVTRILVIALLVILGAFVGTFLLYPIYAVVIDDLGPIEAFKKGIQTSAKAFMSSLGFLAVMLVITTLIILTVTLLGMFLGGMMPLIAAQVVTVFINGVVQAYLSMVLMVAVTVFYLAKSNQAVPGAAATK